MMLSRSDEMDLLLPLYDGLQETPMWVTFLERLRRKLRCDGVALILAETYDNAGNISDITRFISGKIDLHTLFDMQRYRELRPMRIYDADELGEDSTYLRIARVNNAEGGLIAWAMAVRACEDFSAADGAFLSGLLPHLAVALRNLAARRTLEERDGVAGEALARMATGWIMFDGEARVIDASDLADEILHDHFGMTRLRGERLHVSSEAGRVLGAAALACLSDQPLPVPVVTLAERPRLDMLLSRPRRGGAATMIGFLRAAASQGQSPGVVSQLFGLPLSEARLAIALAGGFTIAEAAQDLGLTVETARNYSKKLYAKTGARGQADLVRLMLTGAAAFS